MDRTETGGPAKRRNGAKGNPLPNRVGHGSDESDLRGAVSSSWFAERLRGVPPGDIEDALRAIFASAELAVGTRLPTIRAIAASLGISVGTIGGVWSTLRAEGYIATRRRGGTVIEGRAMRTLRGTDRPQLIELTQIGSDPTLKPSYDEALRAGLRNQHLNSARREYITPSLLAAVRRTWPFEPELWTTAAGGAEATVLAIEAAAPRGSVIAVEQPCRPRVLDLLSTLGLRGVAVPCDENGPTPSGLEQALRHEPAAFYFQPRAQIPLGHHVTEQRAAELATLLRRSKHRCWVVEDDNNGPISLAPVFSIGTHLPDRVVHIRSYCRAYGLELRTSVLAGAAPLITQVRSLRSHGFAMNSRLLQDALAYLLNDRAAQRMIETARRRYASRRDAIAVALRERGLRAHGKDGTRLWIDVDNDVSAANNLSVDGIVAEPGSRYFLSPPATAHISISTSRISDRPSDVARLAAAIASGIHRRAVYLDE